MKSLQDELENPLDYPYRARGICRHCMTGFLVGSGEERFDYIYPCPNCGKPAICLAFHCYFKPIKEKI